MDSRFIPKSRVLINASDPASIVLLEAAKQDPNLQAILVVEASKIRRDVVHALADCLDTNLYISELVIMERHDDEPDHNAKRPARHDYTTLIAAIAASPSLQRFKFVGNAALELEKAIVEGLKRKRVPTTLILKTPLFILRNPIGFAELLVTGTSLRRLELCDTDVECFDESGTNALGDAIRKSQSLKELTLCNSWSSFLEGRSGRMGNTITCVLDGLVGNQSLETLAIAECFQLHAGGVFLLNKVLANNRTLTSLSVTVHPDGYDAICEALSHSPSIKELSINWGSAVSCLLEKTTSLQVLHFHDHLESTHLEELSVGLRVCTTLTTLSLLSWPIISNSNLNGVSAVLHALIVNRNLKEIQLRSAIDTCFPDHGKDGTLRERVTTLNKDLIFFQAFNQHGRSLVGSNISSGVWPYALEKAGRCSLPDALYFLLHETPELVMHYSSHYK